MLGTILQRAAARFPDNLAISVGDVKRTYLELEDSVARIASALQAYVQPGDRVACFLHNGPEIIEVIHACLRIGVSVVFISPLFKANEASTILAECKPRVVFTEHEIYETVIKPTAPQLPFIELYCLRVPMPAAPAGTCSLVELKSSATGRRDAPIAVPEDQEACVFYSSGSTGAIKGIAHGHRKLMAAVTDAMHHFALSSDDRMLFCEPLCGNSFPLALAVLPAAFAGAQLTWLPTDTSSVGTSYEATIERAIHTLVDERITYLATGPFTLKALVKRLERDRQRAAGLDLRCCIIGGDVIPDDTYRRFRELFGFPVCELYGLTEALSCAITPVDGSAQKGEYRPFGDTEFRIIDENWLPLPTGREGEIAVHSALVMLGYVNDPETTTAVLRGGWLRTGDLGFMDQDGGLRFVGRLKHIICYDGDNIGPQEVESALLDHPRVMEACVVGIPSRVNGEVPAAYVVVSGDDKPIEYNEIAMFLADRLASYKIPVAVRFVDALPRNVNRKIDRKLLITRATEDFAGVIAAETEY
ncbi:MAG TPA: class I adenylate-forming enzyme family protein [Kofleriaceae bacterium]|nr:class I adenylate-forming enzyme family protein [Kofleriaceae bacterium]